MELIKKYLLENIDTLLIGIVASLVAILLQIFVKISVVTISYFITSRLRLRKLFSFANKSRIFVVSGSIQQKNELSLLASPDADAAANIVSALKDVLPKSQLIRYYSTKDTSSILNENIITIGGPVYNTCRKNMFDNLSTEINFDENDNLIFDNETYSKSVENRIDYGIVARINNPFSTAKRLIIIAGCGSHGVLAGSLLFDKYREFKNLYTNFKKNRGFFNRLFNKNFIAIIKCKMTNNYISNLEIVKVKTIES